MVHYSQFLYHCTQIANVTTENLENNKFETKYPFLNVNDSKIHLMLVW